MTQNQIDNYKSLQKQDTENRKLIKKLQLDKQALTKQLNILDVSESLTEEILNEEGEKYEKELNKHTNYYIDRDYQIYHYKMGIVKGYEIRNSR